MNTPGTPCSGSCQFNFDTTRYAFDDRGSIHMLQVLVGDIPANYYIECAASVASTNVQNAWRTRYQLPQPPIIQGTPSTSTTATLRYVSGYGSDGTVSSGLNTASGTLTVMEGQQAVVLACIYSNKNSQILVTFTKVGTGVLVRRFYLVNFFLPHSLCTLAPVQIGKCHFGLVYDRTSDARRRRPVPVLRGGHADVCE